MKIWKDKEGKSLTRKEFFKRWKSGIEGITPIQKLKTQSLGTKIMILGIVIGLIICIIGYKILWWLGIILLGALINTFVQYLGIKQQLLVFKEVEKNCKTVKLDEMFEGEELEDQDKIDNDHDEAIKEEAEREFERNPPACMGCGEIVNPNEKHTFEDCENFKKKLKTKEAEDDDRFGKDKVAVAIAKEIKEKTDEELEQETISKDWEDAAIENRHKNNETNKEVK